MFADENEPKKKLPYQVGQDISDLSVDDLNEIIFDLKAEIERLENEAKAKQHSKNAADAFFKS